MAWHLVTSSTALGRPEGGDRGHRCAATGQCIAGAKQQSQSTERYEFHLEYSLCWLELQILRGLLVDGSVDTHRLSSIGPSLFSQNQFSQLDGVVVLLVMR
jgi:hypothetical protein